MIAGDELDTAVAHGPAGPGAWTRRTPPARRPPCGRRSRRTRSRLLGTLYTSLLPAIDAQLIVAGAAARRRPAGRARRHRAVRPAVGRRPRPAQPGRASPTAPGRRRSRGQPDRRLPAGQRAPGPAVPDASWTTRSADHAQRVRQRGAAIIGLHRRRRRPRHRARRGSPVYGIRPHPPGPGARPGPGGVRRHAADRQRRGRGAPAAPAPPGAHAARPPRRGAQPQQQRGPAGGGHAPAGRLAARRDLARRGAALVPGGAVGPDAPRGRRPAGPALLPGVRPGARAPPRAFRSRSAAR